MNFTTLLLAASVFAVAFATKEAAPAKRRTVQELETQTDRSNILQKFLYKEEVHVRQKIEVSLHQKKLRGTGLDQVIMNKYEDGGYFSLEVFSDNDGNPCPSNEQEAIDNTIAYYNLQLGRKSCVNIKYQSTDYSFAVYPNLNQCGSFLQVVYAGKDCSPEGSPTSNVLEYEETSVIDVITDVFNPTKKALQESIWGTCIHDAGPLDIFGFEDIEIGIALRVSCQDYAILPNFEKDNQQERLSTSIYANSPECFDIQTGTTSPVIFGSINMYQCYFYAGNVEIGATNIDLYAQLEFKPNTHEIELVSYNNAQCTKAGALNFKIPQVSITFPGPVNGPCGADFALVPNLINPEATTFVSKVCVGCSVRDTFPFHPIPPVTTGAKGYAKCGGKNFDGPTFCIDGWTCKKSDDYYSQCIPEPPKSGEAGFYGQCDGPSFATKPCAAGSTCEGNTYYKQCIPTSVP